MDLKKYTGKMYCFSPPVMLFTFLFEFGALFYVLWRYKMDTFVRLSALTLGALGTFQLAEYLICGGLGLAGTDWARLGYISITLLPALGFHMVATLAGKKVPYAIGFAYGTMAAFVTYFFFSQGAIASHECRPNYAVFEMSGMGLFFYAIYYYGWLVVNTVLALRWSQTAKHRHALRWLTVGMLAFIVPTVTATIIQPETAAGIPSIMCGFAVILAAIIVGVVLPNSRARVKQSQPRKERRRA